MNLKEQATLLLQKLIETAIQTGEFIKEQVPLVVQELITYHLVYAAVWCIIWATVAVLVLLGARKFIRLANEEEDSEYYIPAVLMIVFGTGPATWASVTFLLDVVKLWLAPRVWLIEYASQLVK